MKNVLVWSLMLLPVSPGWGMESKISAPESQSLSSPFYITELRLLITEFLCKGLSREKALTALRAWALVEKRACSFFQTKEEARNFIVWFTTFSYQNDFILPLNKLAPLLHPGEFAVFDQSLHVGDELVELFERIAREKEWDIFLTLVPSLEATLSGYLAHYYWESSYNGFYAQKTLLGYALELHAPQEVIQTLIRWGSCLNQLHQSTPSSCLIVCQNSITLTGEYEKKLKEHNVDGDSLRKEIEPILKGLYDTLEMLIEKGASVNTCFFAPIFKEGSLIQQVSITPICMAAQAHNLPLLTYLLEKGAYCDRSAFYPLLVKFVNAENNLLTYPILETILSKTSTSLLPSLCTLTIETALKDTHKRNEENYCKLLTLFLNNTIMRDESKILKLISRCGNYTSKIVDFLTENGALSQNSVKIAYLTDTTQDILERLKGEGEEISLYEVLLFLAEVKTELLTHEELPLPKRLIAHWLAVALHVHFSESATSNAGKELWKLIAVRFPSVLLFRMLVHTMHTIKSKKREEEYRSILTKAHELVTWLSKEGIKDYAVPTASVRAQELGIQELSSSLATLFPDFFFF